MASSLVRRGFVSAYRLTEKTLSSRNSTKMSRILEASSWFSGSRSYVPTPISKYQERLKTNLTIMPGAHSFVCTKVGTKQLVMQVPGLEIDKAESDKGLLRVSLNVGGAKDFITRIDGNHLLIECFTTDGVTHYLAGMRIPFTCNEKRGLKGMAIKDGRLIVTLPTGRFRLAKFLSNFLLMSILRLFNYHDYYVFSEIWFSLGHLRRKEIPSISAPNATHRSFTNYKKKKTAGSVYVKLSRDELEQIESAGECLCVSVKMPGFKIEDVKLSFENDYNALVVQGKTETEHYLACFHIPEGYETEIGNFKTEMHQGVYKATLPCKQKEEN